MARYNAARQGPIVRERAYTFAMLNIGIIGCGHWGPNHIRNLSRLRGVAVRTVADLSRKRLDAVLPLYPGVTGTTKPDEVLEDPAIDAVVIATPTVTHAALVSRALRRGKHVLVEKPLARTVAEARRLVAQAAKHERILMVGHVFLYNGGIQELRRRTRKDCGTVHYLHATRTNLGPFREDVNVVWDLASHDVSVFSHVLGEEPVEVSARGACYLRKDIADVAFITLQYPSGVVGNIHVSWLDPEKVRTITAVGTRRMVTWNDLHPTEPVRIFDKRVDREPYYSDFGEFQLLAREGAVVSPKVKLHEPLFAQAEAFAKACRTGRPPVADGRHGLRVVEVLHAVQQSINAGGTPKRVRYAE